jgi:hypothetical protein
LRAGLRAGCESVAAGRLDLVVDEDHIGTTGYHPNGWPVGETPPNGLCAAAAAFPATQSEVLDNLDQLHRLRLAVRRRGRRQRRLLRRARGVLD